MMFCPTPRGEEAVSQIATVPWAKRYHSNKSPPHWKPQAQFSFLPHSSATEAKIHFPTTECKSNPSAAPSTSSSHFSLSSGLISPNIKCHKMIFYVRLHQALFMHTKKGFSSLLGKTGMEWSDIELCIKQQPTRKQMVLLKAASSFNDALHVGGIPLCKTSARTVPKDVLSLSSFHLYSSFWLLL